MKINDILKQVLFDLPRTKVEELVLAYILKRNDLYRDNEQFFNENYDHIKNKTSLFIDENCQRLFILIKNKIDGNSNQNNPANFESLKIANDNNPEDKKFNAFINSLMQKVDNDPSVEDFSDYIAELNLFRVKRKTIESSIELISKLCDKKSERIDKQETYIANHLDNVSSLITSKKGEYPILYADDMRKIIEEFMQGIALNTKISTGIYILDEILNYLRLGELIVVAGRPGMGKTSLGLNIMYNLVVSDIKCLFFSLEMSRNEITQKMLNLFLKHNVEKNMTDGRGLELSIEDKIKVNDYCSKINNSFSFVDKPFLSLEEIKRYVKEYNLRARLSAKSQGKLNIDDEGVKVIFIDYLQILNSSSSNPMLPKTEKIAKITQTLKALALETQSTIILMSQLNRDNVKAVDKRPNMSQLKDSGAIEQDANKIILLHREEYYEKTNKNEEFKKALKGIAEVIVDKNRGGQTGTVYLDWIGETQEFLSLEGDEAEARVEYYEKAIAGELETKPPEPKSWTSKEYKNNF